MAQGTTWGKRLIWSTEGDEWWLKPPPKPGDELREAIANATSTTSSWTSSYTKRRHGDKLRDAFAEARGEELPVGGTSPGEIHEAVRRVWLSREPVGKKLFDV